MTYGDSVDTDAPDEIWTQQVQEQNGASTLHGLHTIHKTEQEHPSVHNGAAMQSPEARKGEQVSWMGMLARAAIPVGAIALGDYLGRRQRRAGQPPLAGIGAQARALGSAGVLGQGTLPVNTQTVIPIVRRGMVAAGAGIHGRRVDVNWDRPTRGSMGDDGDFVGRPEL